MGRKHLLILIIVLVSLAILGIGVYYLITVNEPYQTKEKAFERVSTDFSGYKEERVALEGFVSKHFIHDGFIRTNLIETEQGELASGEDFLSESAGLLMLYYLRRDERQNFDGEVKILKTHFINSNGLIRWRIRRGQNRETVNSTIDDLRIVKALIMAAHKWGRKDYQSFAQELSVQLRKQCVSEDTLKAYDSPTSPEAPLAYYDFKAMQLMGEFDKTWRELATINRADILNRHVKGFPLYEDNRFSKDNAFSTVENLLIMMHLSEVGIKDPQSMRWLKNQLRRQGLFGSYTVAGEPRNSVESPAIYAMIAIIARLNRDEELYHLAAERLKKMQNMKNNEYYGGFVDLERRAAFSFDQLCVLLAY